MSGLLVRMSDSITEAARGTLAPGNLVERHPVASAFVVIGIIIAIDAIRTAASKR